AAAGRARRQPARRDHRRGDPRPAPRAADHRDDRDQGDRSARGQPMIVELDPHACLRRATLADLDAIVAIKRSLPMPSMPSMPGGEQTSAGGFLLGSEVEVYGRLLAVARVWLLELDGLVAGFSLTLDDPVPRASPVRARRDAIDWDPGFDVAAALGRRIGYFDQLAVLPNIRRRYWGAALALQALAEQFDDAGHDLVLTTT